MANEIAQMSQAEMAAPPDVHILGINEIGLESGNEAMCENRHLPWLQDTPADSVWASWDVTYRDVVVLDRENRKAAVYNLTVHDLSVEANYDSLKALLIEQARMAAE